MLSIFRIGGTFIYVMALFFSLFILLFWPKIYLCNMSIVRWYCSATHTFYSRVRDIFPHFSSALSFLPKYVFSGDFFTFCYLPIHLCLHLFCILLELCRYKLLILLKLHSSTISPRLSPSLDLHSFLRLYSSSSSSSRTEHKTHNCLISAHTHTKIHDLDLPIAHVLAVLSLLHLAFLHFK